MPVEDRQQYYIKPLLLSRLIYLEIPEFYSTPPPQRSRSVNGSKVVLLPYMVDTGIVREELIKVSHWS